MKNALPWFYLTLAILTEVAGITAMKYSEGFSYLLPSLGIFFFYALSLLFLALSLKQLEVGLAYAIWSALGTFLIFIVGVGIFNEPVTLTKTVSLVLIIVGVMGLKQA